MPKYVMCELFVNTEHRLCEMTNYAMFMYLKS